MRKCKICGQKMKVSWISMPPGFSRKSGILYKNYVEACKAEGLKKIVNIKDAQEILQYWSAICQNCYDKKVVVPESLRIKNINEAENQVEKKETKNINLLQCPDCGRDVSKRASACLNCGCPIEAIIADQDKVKEQKQDEKTNEKKPYNYVDNSPKCPHCGSKSYDKISLKNKIGAAALLGPFAIVHAGKIFKCKSCGFKW